MDNHLPDILRSIEDHIADRLLILRYTLTAAMCIMAIAVLAQSLMFAAAIGLIGIGSAISQCRYLDTLHGARNLIQGVQNDVTQWETEHHRDFWA